MWDALNQSGLRLFTTHDVAADDMRACTYLLLVHVCIALSSGLHFTEWEVFIVLMMILAQGF